MKNAHVTESRRFVALGLLLLLLGAGLLLVCKLPVSAVVGSVCAFAGGAAVLLGNGLIIYGLMVFAGAQNNSPKQDAGKVEAEKD